jgi:hypothetical protein
MSSRVAPPLTDIGKFYKQIDDFKEKIIGILRQLDRNQEIIEINKYNDKLMLAKKANVRTAIELLYQYGIEVYATQILLRDETFFLGEVKNIEKNPKINDEYELDQNELLFINQIKGVWEHLQPTVKTNIWNYVQVICLLAEKIVGGNILTSEKKKLIETGLLK